MKKTIRCAGVLMASLVSSHGETVFGGADTTDVDNWTTSSVVFDDTVQSGHSLNWENVVVNDVTIDSIGNKFDLQWEANTNYTIGHLFIYNESYDLASEAGGIQGLLMTADFDASAFSNWSPVVAVTDGGVTNYYRWNHSNNSFSGNGALDFSVIGSNTFDLSQLGNASNSATAIWGRLNATAGNFGATRTNGDNPNLQAASGTVQFGFIQWGASTGGSVANQTFSTSIDSFEVVINPGDATPPVVETSPGTAISATSISAAGAVTDTGNETPIVTIYYGTTDGLDVADNWDGFVDAGAQIGAFSATVDSLLPNTEYFYRAFASNSGGSAWAPTSQSVTTLSPTTPAVEVSDGSSPGGGVLTMIGEVTDNGNEDPEITIFYGTTDEGTNAAAWDSFVSVGVQGGAFSATVSGLPGDTQLFYRAFAENSGGLAWSPTTASATTLALQGVPNTLDSSEFDYLYEMDVNPSSQDLDLAGSVNDWFLNPATGSGVDQQMWTPQNYNQGIATSNQAMTPPEALFRTDFGGSISRESLGGDFTVEVAVKLNAGTIIAPGFDLGGFALFLNPPGQDSFRLNINEDEVSTGLGNNNVSTGSNTAQLTVFRIAYVESDQRFWVWRDGVLIYGNTAAAGGGVAGSEPSIYSAGGFLIGDFSFDLSGDWELDYIRLHNAAVAPVGGGFLGELAVTGISFVDSTTLGIDFVGVPNREYEILSSADLQSFSTPETPINGTSGVTNGDGIGRVEIDVTGRVPGKLFFRVEEEE